MRAAQADSIWLIKSDRPNKCVSKIRLDQIWIKSDAPNAFIFFLLTQFLIILYESTDTKKGWSTSHRFTIVHQKHQDKKNTSYYTIMDHQ